MNDRHAGLVSRALGRAVDIVLLASLVAGAGWLAKQFLGLEPGQCPPPRAWWHVRAYVCAYLPYAILLAGIVIPPVYRVAFFVVTGQTPGMAVMGLRLLRSDGRPVGLRQAVKRVAIFYVTAGLGSLLIPLTSRRRAVHDIVAGTVVVYDWGDHDRDVRRAIERLRSSAGP